MIGLSTDLDLKGKIHKNASTLDKIVFLMKSPLILIYPIPGSYNNFHDYDNDYYTEYLNAIYVNELICDLI
jgi:hypothetical protein